MSSQPSESDIVLQSLKGLGGTSYSAEFQRELEKRKRVSRGVLYCQYNKETEEYALSYVTILILLGGIILCMYLLIKYTSAMYFDASILPFIVQIIITMGFLFFGLIIHVALVNRSLKIESFNINTIIGIIIGLGVGFLALLFQGIIKGIRFSVVAEDYLMFFLSVAIAEEVFWRFGVQPSLKVAFNFTFFKTSPEYTESGKLIVKKTPNKLLSRLVSSTIAIIITSLLFMLFHIFIYSTFSDLFIIFIMGCIFGIGLEITKRLDTAILAHFIVNLIAGYSLVTQYFGGF